MRRVKKAVVLASICFETDSATIAVFFFFFATNGVDNRAMGVQYKLVNQSFNNNWLF